MAEVKSTIKDIDASIVLLLSEDEARALVAICGYGPQKFLKWFEENLGKHYISKAKGGVNSLFDTVSTQLPQHLSTLDEARKILNLPSKKP